MPSEVRVGHLVGMTTLVVAMRLSNPLDKVLELSPPRLELIEPGGTAVAIPMRTMLPQGETFLQPRPQKLTIAPHGSWDAQCCFTLDTGQLAALTARLTKEATAGNMNPLDPTSFHFSKTLANDLRAFMQNNFRLASGDWQLKIRCRAGKEELDRTLRFTLSNDDITALRNITKYYEKGYGLFAENGLFWDHKDGRAYIPVALQ